MSQETETLPRLRKLLSEDLEFLKEIKRELQKRFLGELHLYVDQQKQSPTSLVPHATVYRVLKDLKEHLVLEDVAIKLYASIERTLELANKTSIDVGGGEIV
jgi:Fe2+ or Zn2+ uptake regulation protein